MEYKHVLIGTDGGELMAPVYEHGAYLARLTGATVHVVCVLDATGSVHQIDSWEYMHDVLLVEGKEALANGKTQLAAYGIQGERVVATVLEGRPAEELAKYAEDHNINLIIIGSHGSRGLNRPLIGSVADKIIRVANVPVLVIRSQ